MSSFPQTEPSQQSFSAPSYGSTDCPGQFVSELNGDALSTVAEFAWNLPTNLNTDDCSVAWSTSSVWAHDPSGWRLAGRYAVAGGYESIPSSVGKTCRLVPTEGLPAQQDADVAEGARSFTALQLAADDSTDRLRIVTTLLVGCELRPLFLFLNRASSPYGVDDNGT